MRYRHDGGPARPYIILADTDIPDFFPEVAQPPCDQHCRFCTLMGMQPTLITENEFIVREVMDR